MGSTVLLKYGKSCDSARWCNFIPSVIKKKLSAASSRSASSCFLLFALCLCPVVSSLFLRSVAYWKLPGVRKLLSWGFEVWSFCGVVWMQTLHGKLYMFFLYMLWPCSPLYFSPTLFVVLFSFKKHLQNNLHTGVFEFKCQWWPF